MHQVIVDPPSPLFLFIIIQFWESPNGGDGSFAWTFRAVVTEIKAPTTPRDKTRAGDLLHQRVYEPPEVLLLL